MKLERRKFLSLTAFAALSSKAMSNSLIVDSSQVQSSTITPNNTRNINIIPKALKKGSTIAITAPASATNIWECHESINFFKKMGCNVVIGDTIKNSSTKYRYLSAPDEVRASEFMKFVEDKNIDCILCARGGYGAMRILPMLNYETIKSNPKIIMGYSDITALINSVYKLCNLVTFHSAIASSIFNAFSNSNLTKILFLKDKFSPVEIKYPTIKSLVNGQASGKIVGGNLSVIAATLGTPYEIDTKDSILLIEETSEEPYKIDRMLTQLWLAGKLQSASALALGNFKGMDVRKCFYPYKSYTLREIFEQRIIPLKKPTIIGLPFGHTEDKLTLPIGINAEIDATKCKMTLLEPSVKT